MPVMPSPTIETPARKASSTDEPLAMTLRGIPLSLRPFFQEYELENIDPDRDAFTVIERTLSWGNRRELRWLFRRYSREKLAEMVRFAGWWRIPQRRFYYWLNVLGITEYRKSDYRRLWPHR